MKRYGLVVVYLLPMLVACGADEGPGPSATPASTGSSASAAGAPDELVLVCDADGSHLSTDRVRVRPDGLHLAVDNRRETDPGYAVRFPGGGGMGDNAPPGISRRVLLAPPGTISLGCYGNEIDPDPEYVEAEIVDPDGLYVDEGLDCLNIVSSISDYVGRPGGVPDPEEAARDRLGFGMQPEDVIRRAGYPESRTPTYVVLRSGDALAKTEVQRGTNGWYTDGYEACEEF